MWTKVLDGRPSQLKPLELKFADARHPLPHMLTV